jgi:hypothetical protein
VFVVRRSPLARPVLVRSATAVVAAVLVAGALTACSGVSIDGDCDPAFGPGDASSIVTASGDVGDSPAVEFPTPLISDDVERSVLVAGSGEPAAPGSTVLFDIVSFVGATGEAAAESTTALAAADDRKLALGEALACATPGSRIVLTGPAEQIDAQYAGTTDTLVAVIDVTSVFLGKANGVNQLPQDGMPTVVTAVDGEPGITSTYLVAPSEPRTATIKAGGGAVVEEGDLVAFHARSWSWTPGGTTSVGSIDSWSTGQPFVLEPTADSMAGQQELADAILGAKVGSQVLVVIPGADESAAATVYVFDILGIVPQD